jgi:hypothetical protein
MYFHASQDSKMIYNHYKVKAWAYIQTAILFLCSFNNTVLTTLNERYLMIILMSWKKHRRKLS